MKTLTELQAAAEAGTLRGLFPGISDEVYHDPACPGRSSTFFKNITSKTPLHAMTALQADQDKAEYLFGRAAHALMQDPKGFESRFVFAPEGMIRNAKHAKYQEFLAANPGKEVLAFADQGPLLAMAEQFLAHPLSRLLEGALIESSGFWEHDGVLCKIRPDFFVDGVVYDYKTTAGGIGPFEFSKTVHTRGYHVSAAMYLEGMSAVMGEKLKRFVLIAQEKEPPYDLVFYDVDDAVIDRGREEFLRGVSIYKQCLETSNFPGYPKDFQSIGLPAYAW